MDTTTFLETFDAFISRRGRPHVMISDNFRTFKKAAEILSVRFHIKWRFNTPLAPWHGGFFERLVRCVKKPLRSLLGTKVVSYDKFKHALVKIEFIVNSRPITAVNDLPSDPRPLCPNDFLTYRGVAISESDGLSESEVIRRHFLSSLGQYRHIWSRWHSRAKNRRRYTFWR